ncbi:DNA-binding helix-turn-helix protein [Lentilactobacillus parafarraginis DSM 18390 = JCM 14109]|jgi:transcriptional regulator with XRE-family HTH domain|uniref:DNA-binding helix-turn-helix protein n=2 Tax=Lentilactobacillus parafarraginis TaxID=390842 RepID=A0A0R1YPF2_9LACO|nr:DNA-binding helix-turn-helix protein [Lentilactobacillus parafarraginis DSM 18390 = JCM 14109]
MVKRSKGSGGKMKIGKVLQQEREKHHWSQSELAAKLQISRQSISKWEQDVSLPSFANVVAISDLFKISLDDLIRGDDELMDKLTKNQKMGPAAKILLWAIGISIVLYGLSMALGLQADDVHSIIRFPLFICLIGLLFTINWRQFNRSLSKPAIIFGIIFLTLLLVPEIYGFVHGATEAIVSAVKGYWEGYHSLP